MGRKLDHGGAVPMTRSPVSVSRRALLQGLLTVPTALALGGCQQLLGLSGNKQVNAKEPELQPEKPAEALVFGAMEIVPAPPSTTLPVAIKVQIPRRSGYLPYQGLAIESHQEGKIVGRELAGNEGIGLFGARVQLSKEGPQTLKAVAEGKVHAAIQIQVAKTPAVGGAMFGAVVPVELASFRKTAFSSAPVPELHITRWRALDRDPAVIIEWRRGGATVFREQARKSFGFRSMLETASFLPQFRPKDLRAWQREPVVVTAPEGWDPKGEWEVILHEQHQPSVRIVPTGPGEEGSLVLRRVSATEIETPPATIKALAAIPGLKPAEGEDAPVTPAEVRALTRSVELFKLREKLSLLHSSGRSHQPVEWIDGESPTAHWQRQRAANAAVDREANGLAKNDLRVRADIFAKMKPLIKQFGGQWTPEETPS